MRFLAISVTVAPSILSFSGLVCVEPKVSVGADETVLNKNHFDASVPVNHYQSDNDVYTSAHLWDDKKNEKQTFSYVGAQHQNGYTEWKFRLAPIGLGPWLFMSPFIDLSRVTIWTNPEPLLQSIFFALLLQPYSCPLEWVETVRKHYQDKDWLLSPLPFSYLGMSCLFVGFKPWEMKVNS